ncbi:MAG: HD domain-containing phosphohydrolase [Methylomonas sp.]|jgi:putative two-component system response regulator
MSSPILIVDDEVINLEKLRHILKKEYRLVYAKSGAEAIRAAEKHRPSLILLDIQMQDMDGYTVCRALKANPEFEAIPVIFVTTLSDSGNEAAGFEAGCVDYLSKPVEPSIVKARIKTHLSLVRATQLEKSHRDVISMLGEAGHYNDTDTGVHIWRMAAYSKALAIAMGWNTAEAELLELAAPMHDTGKIGIPDAILSKPGKLTGLEWEVMRRHCRIGFEILSKSEAPIFKLAAIIAFCHHEQWDGSGYPQSLAGTDIPESARIVAVADVFDALATRRPYKDAWPVEKALATIREGAGKHFDPEIVACFLDNWATLLEIRTEWESMRGI